jgi:hypothetical protein
VVTTEQEEVFRVFDLVGQEKTDRFKRLLSAIDVIPQKEVVGLGRETTVLEKTQQIVVLAVNITYNRKALT